jgi:hypothetical protein
VKDAQVEFLKGISAGQSLGSRTQGRNFETRKQRRGQRLMLPQGGLRDFSVFLQSIDFDLRGIGIDQPQFRDHFVFNMAPA